MFQGERVNCEDNTSLGEFTLAPIPPMKAGDAVNGILKVTATEKTSGRSANITISNSVGKLSSAEIEKMVDGTSLLSYPIAQTMPSSPPNLCTLDPTSE